MSQQLQTALSQLISIIPQIPGFDVLMTLVMVKITAFAIVFATLLTGGILSRLVRSAITDSLHLSHHFKMMNYRNAMMQFDMQKGQKECPCSNEYDISHPENWIASDEKREPK